MEVGERDVVKVLKAGGTFGPVAFLLGNQIGPLECKTRWPQSQIRCPSSNGMPRGGDLAAY